MSAVDFMKKIKTSPDISISLYNERGEYYRADTVRTLIHTNKGVKVGWVTEKPFTHILPFTHAVIHKGTRILSVHNIKPVASDVQPSEVIIEI